jgi:dolichyl-phosphate beta-glucosyltransferase
MVHALGGIVRRLPRSSVGDDPRPHGLRPLSPASGRRTGIAVPCFNEAARLDVEAFAAFVALRGDLVFCFVDDGSTDATWSVLESLRSREPERIRTLRLDRNRGKAEAVRLGVLELLSGGDALATVGYFDADLATPLDQLDLLLTALDEHPTALLAFGSRVKLLGRRIERFLVRHYVGRVFATLASIVVGLPVYDTQCGAKLFRSPVAASVFGEPFTTRWLFDVEIFLRLRRIAAPAALYRDLLEVPLLAWVDKGDSRLRPADLVRVPLDFGRILLRYRAGRSQDGGSPTGGQGPAGRRQG